MGNDDWEENLAKIRKETESFRNMYNDIANDLRSGRTSLMSPATTSDKYSQERPLGNLGVHGMSKTANERFGAAAKTKDAPAKPAAGNSRKRKTETTLDQDIAAYKQDLDQIDVEGIDVDLTCNQVRSRINKVIDSGIMKKGEFCTAIGSSNHSVNTFLKKSGSMDGAQSDAYTNAWAWFKQRELAGLKMPDVKKRQQTEAAKAAAAATTADAGAEPAAKKAKKAAASREIPDLSDIQLYGEERDAVPIFDTCDEIRKKIAAHLKTPGLTQAQFCRDLYAQLKKPTCKGIQTKQLNDFRGKSGAVSGCSSSVFYAAYVYFEKLRIAKGKPKSAHRLDMEEIHPGLGMRRDVDGRTR